MSEPVPVDQNDPRFSEEVGAVLKQRLPHLYSAEQLFSKSVLVVGLLIFLGVFGLVGWALNIIWPAVRVELAKIMAKELEADPGGSIESIKADIARMSTTLNTTFKKQVDTASIKILRFGCTPKGAPRSVGFPACSDMTAAGGLFQALDDHVIFFVAQPDNQAVQLDVSVHPVGPINDLEPLLLQVHAEPPSSRDPSIRGRAPLILKPEQILSEPRGGLLQDGRLRVVPNDEILKASINLTPSLQAASLSGPIQLRFSVVKAREAPPSAGADLTPQLYEPAPGTELFNVRAITYAYHSFAMARR